MTHYKDTDNKLHWLDDSAFEYMLPPGSVQITDEEAQALIPAPIVVIPDRVSKKQAKIQLHREGLLDTVINLINASGVEAQILWTDADYFERNDPLFIQIAGALGKDDAALDQFFLTASEL